MKKTNDQYTWGGKRAGAGRKPEQFKIGVRVTVAIVTKNDVMQTEMTVSERLDDVITLTDGTTRIVVSVTK